MDYKELINRMRYNNRVSPDDIADAAAAIETLLAERDAVVEKIRGECCECVYAEIDAEKYPCNSCHYVSFVKSPDADHWQWRGVQEGCKSENGN